MVADAIHSVSDFATDLVVLLFVRVSAKPRDDDMTTATGNTKRWPRSSSAQRLQAWESSCCGAEAQRSATSREASFRHSRASWHCGRPSYRSSPKKRSIATRRASAEGSTAPRSWPTQHHRSDALSSVGTLVGIGCAYFLGGGWRLADPAAAIVVALLILRVAWQLMKMGMDELLEKSLPREQEEHILTLIAADPAVASPHNLRTRRIGQNIAVEVHIRVDGAMTVTESHRLTVDIERRLRDAYGEGTIVSIHVEPRKQPPVNESK